MPSKSVKQAKFFRAIAHSPEFAKKVGVPVSVGKEFNDADQALLKERYRKPGASPAQRRWNRKGG